MTWLLSIFQIIHISNDFSIQSDILSWNTWKHMSQKDDEEILYMIKNLAIRVAQEAWEEFFFVAHYAKV